MDSVQSLFFTRTFFYGFFNTFYFKQSIEIFWLFFACLFHNFGIKWKSRCVIYWADRFCEWAIPFKLRPSTHTHKHTQFRLTHAAIQNSSEFRNNCVIWTRSRVNELDVASELYALLVCCGGWCKNWQS